ncbi:hypothetical protein HYZ70_00580 [Candidatus Curtissbacteria bacterium]|nr:hypothetical protein [Candidatus Curtissbacteria bacterium]
MTDFTGQHYASRTHEKMREVLMDPSASSGPAVHYHMVRGGSGQRNITIWEPGIVGGEYIKTYGHYHVGKLDETYWVLFGEGVVLVQKRAGGNENPVDDEIEEVYAVHVRVGDSLFIPAGWGHLVANISKTFFVTADDSPVNFEEVDPVSLPGHADYEAVKKMQGFCYYIVEKDGKPVLVKNEKYKKAPVIEIIEASDYPLKK